VRPHPQFHWPQGDGRPEQSTSFLSALPAAGCFVYRYSEKQSNQATNILRKAKQSKQATHIT